jgi:hypothetical protein
MFQFIEESIHYQYRTESGNTYCDNILTLQRVNADNFIAGIERFVWLRLWLVMNATFEYRDLGLSLTQSYQPNQSYIGNRRVSKREPKV